VTHHDLHEDDRDVRDAIHALTPDVDMVFDRIETRAAGIRRRVHRRIGASVVAVVLVGVGVAFALPGAHARASVDIEQPGRSHHGAHDKTTSPTTIGPTETKNLADPSHTGTGSSPPPAVIGPDDQHHEVVVPGASPTTLPYRDPSSSPTTTPDEQTTPTTTRADESTTTTTTVSNSDIPPIAPGHTRMTVILDDTGLHAPSFVATGDAVEILFLDQRSSRPVKSAYLSSRDITGFVDTIMVARWEPSPTAHITTVRWHDPGTIELSVTDMSCGCMLSSHATVTVGAGS
jgi:hypothetical protein